MKLSHRRRISRTWRRAILASALIVVATPVLGEDNQQTELKLRRPAATHTRSDGTVQQNPFFRITPLEVSSPVKLASGKEQSTIRLKPVGSAIGLLPIDCLPTTVCPPAMSITTPTSAVQQNPLIVSQHHQNLGLVETSVEAADDRINQLDWDRRDQPVSPTLEAAVPPSDIGSTDAQPLATPQVMIPVPKQIIVPEPPLVAKHPITPPQPEQLVVPAAPVASLPVEEPTKVTSIPTQVAQPRILQPLPSAPIQDPAIEIAQPAAVASAIPSAADVTAPAASESPEPTEPPAESRPIFFSMSDTSGGSTNEDSVSSEPAVVTVPVEDILKPILSDAPGKIVVRQNDFALQPIDVDEEAIDVVDAPIAESIPAPILIAEAIPDPTLMSETALPEPIVIADASEFDNEAELTIVENSSDPLQAIELIPPSLVYRNEPANPEHVWQEPLSSQNRHRPPVAVDALPLVIERATPKLIETAAAPVTVANPVANAPRQSGDVNLTSLHLTRAQVRSLTIGGQVRGIKIADQNVCQAFTTGPNQLKLIGVNNGVTRLVVWADTTTEVPTQVRTFEIHVNDAVEATGNSLGDKVLLLNQSIANAFPYANVEVKQYRERLVVAGDCDSDQVAKKIIRMVRKTCLIPVYDGIKVR